MEKIEKILDDCLDKIREGEMTLEQCLQEHPREAPELGRLLAAALRMKGIQAGSQADPAFKRDARVALIRHARSHPRSTPRQGRLAWTGRMRLAMGSLAAGVAFLSSGTAFAQVALPGGLLYGWKIASERVFDAILQDSAQFELFIVERRSWELVRVAGNPDAKAISLAGYQRALENLAAYKDPLETQQIQEALIRQQEVLSQSGIDLPELDDYLRNLEERPGEETSPQEGGEDGRDGLPDEAPELPDDDPRP